MSRPIFIYVSDKAMQRSEVKDFVDFYLKNAAKLVPEVKYVALPKKAYELSLKHVKENKLGTVFKGESQVGLKIEELLKKETAL